MSRSRDPLVGSIITKYIRFGRPHTQANEECKNFEIDLARCIQAYGYTKAQDECKAYIDDLQEWLSAPKRMHRSEIMNGEYERQIESGERERNKKPIPYLMFFPYV
ncbi:hypothetical protein WH47_04797 [Habropoda laboriosa]|uniref:Uncharacterized protein n=1 Tax=Habropoda laboriosa TaxID=597456 RepID=A0A0L7QXM1_9HYME|nr:PREDICTED: uncharacterized protein LOC108574179 [Habropoda laboriosa]XP_017792200.1 PREDICTED: uncharacterized protein LOC108574179 [Habropoda laboriosa]XP_017792201.1 PREDICTED: uncharacterized protein LOC108574179 [Habropoda laboriosa]XP_017792203.1 PREDICTED: uncharacterized protein LOC108574179 [Habropoda laboriosa]KOC63348.1 hypothetical protein WH47_04797 [Habropoda laboriosa]